jgi:magnesium chelatase family protein
MLAKLKTFALVGIDAVPVEVEVDVSAGLPKTVLVGLPEMAVKESVRRIERALVNLGYDRHPGCTVINLAPARLMTERPTARHGSPGATGASPASLLVWPAGAGQGAARLWRAAALREKGGDARDRRDSRDSTAK